METESIGNVTGSSEFSLFTLLGEADIVVKLVLCILLLASIWSWVVIGEKLFSLGALKKASRAFEEAFWSGRAGEFDLRPGQGGKDPASRVFVSCAREWQDAGRALPTPAEASAIVMRAERSMRAAVDRELSLAGNGLSVLATIGSASPFIGLFGTVWGIMNAFLNIAEAQDTSLGTVAGPIAEALFATGLGLVAAIPAVIFYNKFTSDLTKLGDQLDTFSQDVLVRLSRRASDATRD
ncbi:MotA/TolQ/ExbB proton channel family protein [Hyphomonas sp.]|jgi:biopolymer transport protein TolQ|uniref:MotA/TolQ/ExbB proton channel family protein n=1 Tax=Hyphomonas sp. TaxID=87 RepID=UPI0025BD7FDC|nr:MotA/TolQ/ExbB proton channel family protein [Hyphomonas sp.]MBI1400121.1 protein TolQ [Hyphomonas sp.]